jgi:hypothetical protein
VDGGAVGPRPQPRDETLATERRYAEIARSANEVRATLPAAQQSLAEALQRLRAVTTERDEAIFAASVEACEPALAELDETIVHVRTIEARLRSLVAALRLVGWNSGDSTTALSAAERVEKRIADARRRRGVPADNESGRRLLELLKTDPAAEL